jgi:Phage regulatory protein CII (CP76)
MNKRVVTKAMMDAKNHGSNRIHAPNSDIGAKPAVDANPQQAFRDVVYRFGVKDLAAKLVMKVGTLYNKCEADEDSHNQPTLRDVVMVTQVTGDASILDSLDRMFNRAAYDVTPGLPVSDQAILELLCKVGSEHGDIHKALAKALTNSRFSAQDLRDVRAEVFELVTAVLTFLQRLEGLVDE